MTTPPVLNGSSIGRAHYAIRALLERHLEPTGFGFEHWIALNALGSAPGPMPETELIAFVTGGLKVSDQQARGRLADLREAGLVVSREDGVLGVTEPGRRLWTTVSGQIRPLTGYLFAGFDDDEKAVLTDALVRITERAEAALATPNEPARPV